MSTTRVAGTRPAALLAVPHLDDARPFPSRACPSAYGSDRSWTWPSASAIVAHARRGPAPPRHGPRARAVVLVVHSMLTVGLMLIVSAIINGCANLPYILPIRCNWRCISRQSYPIELIPRDLRAWYLLNSSRRSSRRITRTCSRPPRSEGTDHLRRLLARRRSPRASACSIGRSGAWRISSDVSCGDHRHRRLEALPVGGPLELRLLLGRFWSRGPPRSVPPGHGYRSANVADGRPGKSIGVISRNGAGKTTLMRLLAGVTLPTEGRIRVEGRSRR